MDNFLHGHRSVIVHRNAGGAGVLGIIPGSMATPGFVVSGKGNAESLNSAAHGAGRMMSRKAANEKFNWKDVNRLLRERGVTVISAGLDEVPMAYKTSGKSWRHKTIWSRCWASSIRSW